LRVGTSPLAVGGLYGDIRWFTIQDEGFWCQAGQFGGPEPGAAGYGIEQSTITSARHTDAFTDDFVDTLGFPLNTSASAPPRRSNKCGKLVFGKDPPLQTDIRLGVHGGQVGQRIAIGSPVFDQPIAKRLHVSQVVIAGLDAEPAGLSLICQPLDSL
jgi:hypothetical protein